MRSSRGSGAALASVGVGRVELLGAGRWHAPPPANLSRRLIAVGSTGGRVGTSTVAAHLAVAMAHLGAQVIAVDMDLRSPSLHALFGMERTALGLQALLAEQIQNLDGSLTRTGVRNLALITGGAAGGADAGVLRGDQKRLLLRQIGALDGEVVIIDLGAVDQDDLIDSFAMGATNLLVASPQSASLAATFAFLSQAAGPGQAGTTFDGMLVGNLAASSEEVEIFHAFSRLVHAQLGLELPVVGCLRADGRLIESTALGRVPVLGDGLSDNDRAFQLIAEALLHQEIPPVIDSPAVPAVDPPVGERISLSASDTELAGSEAGLAGSLDRYRRKHVRHEVDWTATLRLGDAEPAPGDRAVAVRVVDVSMSGAAIEVVSELYLGEAGTLRFDQLPGRPELPVVVKSLNESIRRAGVAFSGAEEPRQQVVAAARAQRSAAR